MSARDETSTAPASPAPASGGVVAFLAGPDGSFVTGADIVADGGFTA